MPESTLTEPITQDKFEGFLHKDTSECFWCGAKFKVDKYDMYMEEVGEFWNKSCQQSVLGHPDCTPRGIEDIQLGTDPEWSMA